MSSAFKCSPHLELAVRPSEALSHQTKLKNYLIHFFISVICSQVSRNQDLGLELLNLLNAKVTLLKQEENLARASNHKREQTAEELRRARDIALGLSSKKERVSHM